MNVVWKLVKRNSLKYFYDRSSVFFSFLSVFILVFVYAVFLGKIQADDLKNYIGDIPGIDVTVTSWLIAGLLTITSFTVPLSILGEIITDLDQKVFDDFLTAPIRRSHILLGYLITSWIVGMMMVMVTFILGQIYILMIGGALIDGIMFLQLLGFSFVGIFGFSALSFFVLSFIKSVSGVGVLSTIVGTTIGFFGGIYMPIGVFEETMQTIIKLNPAAHVSSAFRQILLAQPMDVLFAGAPESVVQSYREFNGIDLILFNHQFQLCEMALYMIIFGIVFYALSLLRLNRFQQS